MNMNTETTVYPRLNDRQWLINWLAFNDPNGCYTDADMIAEGFEPMTLEQARELYLNQLEV